MKKTTAQSIYFSLFLVLSFWVTLGFTGILADTGMIDLEYLDNEIENDNWYVIGGIFIIFVILPVWVAHILTVYKMEQIEKKVE